MSKALVNQATDLSKSGLDLTNPDSMIKVYAIIEKHAKGKKGSVNFKADVLLRKSLEDIKSQAGNVNKVPQDVFLKIKEYIKEMTTKQVERLIADDYQGTNLTALRVVKNYKTGDVHYGKTMKFAKELPLSLQIKNIIWAIKVAKNKITMLEDSPTDNSDEVKENEVKIERLNNQIVKDTVLLNQLKLKESKQAEVEKPVVFFSREMEKTEESK